MEAKKKQAALDRVRQVIGKALEDGVLRKEDEKKYEKILATMSDPDQVVTSKLDGLEKAITLRLQRTMETLGDAGYDTGRFLDRGGAPAQPTGGTGRPTTRAEFEALPSGAIFTAPDGSQRRKP
jgi:hypothetical protein